MCCMARRPSLELPRATSASAYAQGRLSFLNEQHTLNPLPSNNYSHGECVDEQGDVDDGDMDDGA